MPTVMLDMLMIIAPKKNIRLSCGYKSRPKFHMVSWKRTLMAKKMLPRTINFMIGISENAVTQTCGGLVL